MVKVKEIIIIVLLILLFFTCNKPPKTVTKSEVYHTSDTIIKFDTVHHTRLKVNNIIDLDTVVMYQVDTFEYGFALHEYHYKINDSLLNATIVAKSPFKPDIDFNYNIKQFTIKDSVFVKEKSLKGFYYGGEAVVYPLLSQMFIGVAYQDNRGQLFDISAGRDFENKTNLIKLGYKKRF